MSIAFNYAALSHVGKVRKSNQDSGYAGANLLVLADGMGGPAGGDIASAVAVDHLMELDRNDIPADEALDSLQQAVDGAHRELVERSAIDPALAGLGTTCIALLRSEDTLSMVHIGDSRAYLLRGEYLYPKTEDHSFVQYLVNNGQITPEQAQTHPQRSVLLRVLGDSQGEVTLDRSHPDAQVGDRWLLCSDGLCGYVKAEAIGRVLADYETPKLCCEALVEMALEAGAPDNVTCVVADVIDGADVEADMQDNPEKYVVGAAATERLKELRQYHESIQTEKVELVDTPVEEDALLTDMREAKSLPVKKSLAKKILWGVLILLLVSFLATIGVGVIGYYFYNFNLFKLGFSTLDQVLAWGSIFGITKLNEGVVASGISPVAVSALFPL